MCVLTKVKRCLFMLVALAIFPATSSAINYNPSSVKGIAQAYGFVLGQEYSLSRIEKEFSELAMGVAFARSQFGGTFPDIKTKLETQLKKAMGAKPFQATATNLRTKIQETLGHQKITSDIAANFLQQVKARSKGEIESPVLEYLLAVEYTDNPVGEFLDGFRQRYKTDGSGKSQGIQLTLQLPRSWLGKEGERPHIVNKWESENGTGMEMIAIEIHDAQGYNPTKKEMEEFVRSGEVKDTAPQGSTYITGGNFNLEMQTGYWMQVAMSGERAGWKFYQDCLIYQLFFRGKAIGVTCSAMGPVSEKLKVNEAFKKVRPLCQQVLNSLVLTQAY